MAAISLIANTLPSRVWYSHCSTPTAPTVRTVPPEAHDGATTTSTCTHTHRGFSKCTLATFLPVWVSTTYTSKSTSDPQPRHASSVKTAAQSRQTLVPQSISGGAPEPARAFLAHNPTTHALSAFHSCSQHSHSVTALPALPPRDESSPAVSSKPSGDIEHHNVHT